MGRGLPAVTIGLVLAAVLLAGGCGSGTRRPFFGLGSAPPLQTTPADAGHAALSTLSWVGGLAMIGGLIALMLSRGTIGLRAVVAGAGLVVLNYAIAVYAGWILIPAILASGIVSLSWGVLTIRQAWRRRTEQA